MAKELEALDWLLANEMIYRGRTRLPISPMLREIKQRLEAIDNANPSEALECLENIGNWELANSCMEKVNESDEFAIIKQALLKQQEQEKFFDDRLVFKNGCIMSGFDYKGKQIVAMPLEEYDEFMKQEKALKIIFEKNVNTLLLELAENVDEYNERIVPNGKLTEEEFNLLKEMLE